MQFQSSVRSHSRHHLELKTDYPLDRTSGITRYRTDLYFFFPNQLNMNEKVFGIRRVLRNIKMYTRFSTPKMSLRMLSDHNNELSPIHRIRALLETPETEIPRQRDPLVYELQVLSNIYRAELENTVELISLEILKQNRESPCRKKIEDFISEIKEFLSEFRKLHTLFLSPRLSEMQRTALAWCDESISIISERSMNKLFSSAELIEKSDKILPSMEKLAKNETAYRRSMDYKYLYDESNPNMGELLAYRESMLKKWAQSAMYMTREENPNQRRVGHILAGTAAGVAMLFAVIATIFAGKIFIPNTIPWVLVIILSYIFKDRIKEVLREGLRKLFPVFTSDQHSFLYDKYDDTRVGSASSLAEFTKAGRVPEDIQRERNTDPNPFQSILPEQDVLHYRRIIDLNSKKLEKNHTRLTGITEILRFQIADWLREMDDPKDIFYRLDGLKKIKIKGDRVYKIHLVMSLNTDLYHYSIIMNRAGILRIEELSVPSRYL